jgi:hypothetical protein
MKHRGIARTRTRISIVSLFLVLGTLIMSACAVTQGERIIPVEQASLRDTVKIEVMEFDPDSAQTASPYVQLLTITDTQILDQLLDALDTDLQVALKVECIPEYELHFHLQDGTVQPFGYSCYGASFIRGKQDFWQGEDYDPPERFDTLLQEQLATTVPSEVNIVAQAGLTQTVKVEIYETVRETLTPEAEGRPAVVQAQVFHRLTITVPESIGRIVAALDTVVPLGPRAGVPTPFVLQFHLNDGTIRSLGYASGGEDAAILRVDGLRSFSRQDAQPPAEFEGLIVELMATEANGP